MVKSGEMNEAELKKRISEFIKKVRELEAEIKKLKEDIEAQ